MDITKKLNTLVWIYDLKRHIIRWANPASLEWWEAESVEALNLRDFKQNTSDAVKQILIEFEECFNKGEVLKMTWQYSPLGKNKEAFCYLSGIYLENAEGEKELAMLIEATPIEHISPQFDANAIATLACVDFQGNILSSNPPFTECFGHKADNIFQLVDEASIFTELKREIKTHHSIEHEVLLQTKEGTKWFLVNARVSPRDRSNLLINFSDIHKLKSKEKRLIERSQNDALTGLLNRAGAHSHLDKMVKQAHNFSILYIDLDGFKLINDSFGHDTGDGVLRLVSERIKQQCVNTMRACRFGGDEFLVIVPEQDSSEMDTKLDTLVSVLSAPYTDQSNNVLLISASIGVAKFPDDANNVDDLIRFADAAMYYSKEHGKQQWTHFAPGMDKALLRKSLIAKFLPQAINDNELALHYQSIVNVKTGKIYSFEALLRWSHYELGVVNPLELVKIAEDLGLIETLERWVINQALSDLKELRSLTQSQAKVAINLSATHMVKPELPNYVFETLKKYSLTPQDIELELTENMLVDDLVEATHAIDTFHEHGVSLSIDDFGTGYSSLAYLHTIKADIVKIDQAFLKDDSQSRITLSAIKSLIEAHGMTTLIEGVETQENAKMCHELEIDLHQGYYYQKPAALEAFKTLSIKKSA